MQAWGSLRADSTDFFSERFSSSLQEENLSEKGSVESARRLAWGPLVIFSKLQNPFYNRITKEFYLLGVPFGALGGRGPLAVELKITLIRYPGGYITC